MKNISSLYVSFRRHIPRFDYVCMQFAEMTYAYHCCAFEFPEKQKGYDSNVHRHYEEFKEKIADECTVPPTQSEVISNKKKHRRSKISVSSHSSFSRTIRKCQLWHFRLYFVKIKKNSSDKMLLLMGIEPRP